VGRGKSVVLKKAERGELARGKSWSDRGSAKGNNDGQNEEF